jgi:ankyrin repeat protein
MIAARTGRPEAVAALVAQGASVNAAGTARQQTPLMWAAAAAHTDVVRALVAAGADVQARSTGGYTALLFAAKNANREVTGILLDAGARVNDAAEDGTTPLLLGTIRGQTAYARFLIERGANPDPMAAGYTPLHWAAGEWDSEVTSGAAEDSEWGALGGLRGADKLAFVKHLIERGANPNAEITRNPRRFGGGGSNLVGGTPFLLAAMAGDVPVMRALLDAGADPLKATRQGTTPLMLAAGLGVIQGVDRVPPEDALAAARLCLERGGDVRAINALGETALHGAVYRGSNPLVQLLVERGADLHAEDKSGRTALALAEGVYRAGAYIILPETAALLRKLGAQR